MASKDFQESSATLCQIFVIFRHGTRAPLFIWPSDPNKSLWPNGVGSLSNKGKQQGHLIGRFLRKKYGDILSEKYLKDEFCICSTDTDRTIMTALCCLSGLYPPQVDDVWLDNMPWQPIPVNTQPEETDPFALRFDQDDYVTSLEKVDITKCEEKDPHRILYDHKNILKSISDKSKSIGADGTLYTLAVIIEGFLLEMEQGLPAYLPPGIDLDKTTAATIVSAMLEALMQSKITMMSSANLMKDILSKAEKKIAGEIPQQKAYLYSSHDLTIHIFLTLLNVPASRPACGAALVVEMHKHPEEAEYYIKLIYKENIESSEEPKALPVNGSTLIPFTKFKEIIQGIQVEMNC